MSAKNWNRIPEHICAPDLFACNVWDFLKESCTLFAMHKTWKRKGKIISNKGRNILGFLWFVPFFPYQSFLPLLKRFSWRRYDHVTFPSCRDMTQRHFSGVTCLPKGQLHNTCRLATGSWSTRPYAAFTSGRGPLRIASHPLAESHKAVTFIPLSNKADTSEPAGQLLSRW